MTERDPNAADPSRPGVYADLLGEAADVSAKAVDRLHALHDRYPAAFPPPVIEQVDRGHADPTAERRAVVRLPGDSDSVAVRTVSTGKTEAAVLDRSPGGLSLRVGVLFLPGSVLGVYFPSVGGRGWVPVEVRHARPDGGTWVLGCAFVAGRPVG